MVIKKISLILLFFVLVPITIGEVNTELSIQSGVNEEITINVLKPVDSDLIQDLVTSSDDFGKAVVNFSSQERTDVDFYVIARKYGNIMRAKRFNGYVTGGVISLDLLKKEDVKKQENITNNASSVNTTINAEVNYSVALTASVTAMNQSTNNQSSKSSLFLQIKKSFTTIIIIALSLIVIGFIIFLCTKMKNIARIFKSPEDREIADSEKKLSELQKEIAKIRAKRDRIKELEDKYKQARIELEELKKSKSL